IIIGSRGPYPKRRPTARFLLAAAVSGDWLDRCSEVAYDYVRAACRVGSSDQDEEAHTDRQGARRFVGSYDPGHCRIVRLSGTDQRHHAAIKPVRKDAADARSPFPAALARSLARSGGKWLRNRQSSSGPIVEMPKARRCPA